MRSRPDLLQRVQRLEGQPRKLDLTFQGMPVTCYDNTWKVAVSELVKASDVVLMDLRQYSEERKGCEYEVDLLLDAVAIDRVVFLVDPPSVPRVQQLILDRWEWLRATSPNLTLDAPHAVMYVSSSQNNQDIQGIMDVLLGAASGRRPPG